MRTTVALLFLAGLTLAAPDALKQWKAGRKRIQREEKRFHKGFQKEWVAAEEAFYKPWQDARKRTADFPNPVMDYSGFVRLYEEHAAFHRAYAALDKALALSGHKKAPATLLKELFAATKLADTLDAKILGGRPVHNSMFDQKPSVERHGLAVRIEGLVAALAAIPDGAGFLAGEAWEQAVKKDGRRSITRRVGVIDALGLTGDVRAREKLEAIAAAPEAPLRVAAVEGLLRFGPDARPALIGSLSDPMPAVRRAVVTGIGADDPGWIAPLLKAYANASGVLRRDIVTALSALTKQTFGDAPKQWQEWYADYKERIDSGEFDKKDVEVREAKPVAVAGALPFYGQSILTEGAVFVLDGHRRMWWPASWAVQKTRYKYDWDRTLRSWSKEHASNQQIVTEQLKGALAAAPDGFPFGIILLQDNFKTKSFGKKLTAATKPRRAAAVRFLDDISGDGWCAQLEGLFHALRLADMGPEQVTNWDEPKVDTIVLVSHGDPAGGRYLSAAAMVAAFQRLNRFRRLVLHTVRIANDGDQAEALMKGLAEATGGTYTWAAGPETK